MADQRQGVVGYTGETVQYAMRRIRLVCSRAQNPGPGKRPRARVATSAAQQGLR